MVTHSAQSNAEWTAENDVGDFPPIGLMYIAGYLRKYAPHHEIKIIDANLLRYSYEDIRNELYKFKPDVVGITVYTDILYDCLQIFKIIKKISKDIYIVVGGTHAINHPAEAMNIPEVDFACIGEGEVIFAKLVEAIEKKDSFSDIKGLLYRGKNGDVIRNDGSGYIDNLDALPYPAFDLVPFKKYYSMIGTGVPTAILCSSRGCPYQCSFCSKLYNTYRGRSPNNIIAEMRLYYNKGIREFMFFDDMFNVTIKRAIDISRAIRENFNDIEWSFRGRADQINEVLADELKKANCKQISFGAEAHTDEILEELKTRKKIAYVKNAVKILRENKIRVNTNWIIGLPQHKSAKDIEEMLRVIYEIDSDYVQFAILMLWEDTELFKEAVRRNIVNKNIWQEFIRDPKPQFLIPCWEEHLSRNEQSSLLRECYIKFYLRPRTIINQIIDIKSWRMLNLKFKGFLIMLIPFFYPVIRFLRPDLSKRKNIHKL